MTSVLAVGSMALDSVETPFGKRDDVLGGSAAYFATAASFLTETRLVAVVGADYPEEALNFLRDRGVKVEGVTRAAGPTFRWRGRYGFDLNDAKTLETQLNVFANFEPVLPKSYLDSEILFLGNIHPQLQSRVLKQATHARLIAADTMNLWISTERAALLNTLKGVHLLFVNDGEARQLSGEHHIVKAARAIQSMGPHTVVIKRGEYGAMLFQGDHVFAAPAFPLPALFDPTGAGDSFAGGFLGRLARADAKSRLDARTLRQAVALGGVMASFTCEAFSFDRLRTLTRQELAHRYGELQRLTVFEDLPSELLTDSAQKASA